MLDISNNEEDIWTTIFDPSSSLPPSPTATPTPSIPISHDIPVIVGVFVGYLILGLLFVLGGFFLYKWNHSKAIPNPEDIEGNNDDDENLEIPIRRNTNDYGTANTINVGRSLQNNISSG